MASATTLRIAWRNLGRNRRRSALVLGAIALGQLTFLSTAALMRGYGEQYFDSITGPLIGHIQVHAPGWRDDRSIDLTLDDVEATLSEIRQAPAVAHASARIYAPALAAVTEDGFMTVVVGVDPEAESHAGGLLAGGGWSESMGEHRVLVGSGFGRQHDIEAGMEIAVVGQDVDGSIANDLYTVAAILSSPVEIVDARGIVMTIEDAQDLLFMPDQAHEIVVHLDDRELAGDVAAGLSSLPLLEGSEVLPWLEIVPQVTSMMRVLAGFTYVVLFVVFIAAAAGITNTMVMSAFERTHEFGMLLSLGCGPGRLSGIIAVEAAILGLLGVALGTVVGVGLVAATAESGVDYAALGGGASYQVAFQGLRASSIVYPRIYASDIATAVVAMLLTSFAAVVWPIARIARLEPVEAMRS